MDRYEHKRCVINNINVKHNPFKKFWQNDFFKVRSIETLSKSNQNPIINIIREVIENIRNSADKIYKTNYTLMRCMQLCNEYLQWNIKTLRIIIYLIITLLNGL